MWEKQAAVGSLRRTTSSSTKGMRELQNLISTVNYDGQVGKRTDRKSTRLNSSHSS